MYERARTAVLAWQQTVDAAWQQQLDPLGGQPPGPDATPRQVADWWRMLSPSDQLRYVTERPDLVAGMDGLPARARDDASRVLLDLAIADLRRQVDHWRAEDQRLGRPPGSPPSEFALLAQHIDERLTNLTWLRDQLGADQRLYLLGFDNADDGRAIVARGNPDTAANVATYVPGAESSFAQLDRLMRESGAMYESANRVANGQSSSVITWLGYDAPDTVPHAYDESYAVDANHSLDRFQQGLHAVNPDAHRTLVGHSYGSLVVGHAARDGELPVDDILAIGSPGMGVQTAGELGIPADRVWVIEANRDLVADLGHLGWHGADPGDDDFGANQLPADPEGRRPTTAGDIGSNAEAHLNYFYDTPSTRPSHENIGDVIAGRPPSHR